MFPLAIETSFLEAPKSFCSVGLLFCALVCDGFDGILEAFVKKR